MFRTACFIDGGYLDRILRDEFGSAKIDYHRLAQWMAGGVELLRIYYYQCPPYQSSNPTEEEKRRFASAERFFASLRRLPRFEVRLGKLEFRGLTEEGLPIFEQKRVDIMLGVDLVRLASRGKVTHAAIFTGDSDFVPAIAAAKDEGVLIHLFHSGIYRPHKELWETCDERIELNEAIIHAIKRD